jgi:hypothetical protein
MDGNSRQLPQGVFLRSPFIIDNAIKAGATRDEILEASAIGVEVEGGPSFVIVRDNLLGCLDDIEKGKKRVSFQTLIPTQSVLQIFRKFPFFLLTPDSAKRTFPVLFVPKGISVSPCRSIHNEEGGVVRGKYRRVFSQNRRNGWMPFEFLVQELPDQLPAPPFRMIETRIKGKVPFIKGFSFDLLGFRSVDRHIEYGKIQEADAIMMFCDKLKGPSRFYHAFRGSSKKKIDIGGNSCLSQVF